MFQEKLRSFLLAAIAGKGTEIGAAVFYKGQLACVEAAGCEEANASIEDLFNVGSISKVYCAAAMMKLLEEKNLSLDTRVCDVLPGFSMADPRFRQITLRMCLNHSSGLPGTGMRMAFLSKFLYDDFKKAFLEYLSRSRLKASPGSFSVYCNDGFDVAALVIEALSGESYGSYLKRAVLQPIGALSTGTAESCGGGKLVVQQGCCAEYLACVGSGGIVTNLADCARFGAEFAGSDSGLFQEQSLTELTRAQGCSRTGDDMALKFGLGWDTVDLSIEGWDFGSRTLGKSGGTSQFSSYLLVSPEHRLSVAISATKDTGINAIEAAAKIAAAFLACQGVDVSEETQYSGLYFGNRSLFRASLQAEQALMLEEFTPQGWETVHRGSRDPYSFVRRGSWVDLKLRVSQGKIMLAQKWLPAAGDQYIPTAWDRRIGRTYIVCNGHPCDIDIADMVNGITLYRAPTEKGSGTSPLLLFCGKERDGFRMMPALPRNDYETDYVLDGEGAAGCRDTFAPFICVENGFEVLYDGGVQYIDTAELPILSSQIVCSSAPQKNPVFRTKAGVRMTAYKPETVKILLYDEKLALYYDERCDQPIPILRDGYAVFLNRDAFAAEVVCDEQKGGDSYQF